jgi:hypothetical protein
MRALKSTTDFNNAHRFMPSDKKKCYSYIRWSSEEKSGVSTLKLHKNSYWIVADLLC